MRLLPLALALAASIEASSQDKTELKWTLVTGDRYTYEVSNEITETEASGKAKKRVTKRTFKLSAILEVVDGNAYPVQVELAVIKTSGRTEVDRTAVKGAARTTEAGDWERPLSGTYVRTGEMRLNAGDLKQKAEGVDLANYVFMSFPLLPEKKVRLNEQWPGNNTDFKETLRLASLVQKEKYLEATIEGTEKGDSEIVSDVGVRLGSKTVSGTTRAVLDATSGWFKSVELTSSCEHFETGNPKATKSSSRRLTVALGRLDSRKK